MLLTTKEDKKVLTMDWDRLKTFYVTATLGSLFNASIVLNRSHAAISRRISHLEDDLGIKLFQRHRRGVDLTPSGQPFYTAVDLMFAALKSEIVDGNQ